MKYHCSGESHEEVLPLEWYEKVFPRITRLTHDVKVDLRGGPCGGESKFSLCMGKILTSCEERMVGRGVNQLDRALGLFKFVWETTGMKGVLDLQGHLWCVGVKDWMLTYRGNVFFVHGIRCISITLAAILKMLMYIC
ncbi:hypothetical protein CFOL_v3_06052 [Cephalotus follicularis]|uniref:Uncharacterized protein n=1 Tax=Cephalotus follicularis TaxID=3775 RepID=A0A1Q3B3L6_CEPFO|nr:hypothetical protein CFOL_v3_06052 [Cephalotus follicularis]